MGVQWVANTHRSPGNGRENLGWRSWAHWAWSLSWSCTLTASNGAEHLQNQSWVRPRGGRHTSCRSRKGFRAPLWAFQNTLLGLAGPLHLGGWCPDLPAPPQEGCRVGRVLERGTPFLKVQLGEFQSKISGDTARSGTEMFFIAQEACSACCRSCCRVPEAVLQVGGWNGSSWGPAK